FQTLISQRASTPAEARLLPPGENTTDVCLPGSPNNITSPDCRSRISTVAPVANAINTPFGENERADTGASHSFKIVAECGCHKRMVPSSPPDTTISPNGETATER